MKAESLPDSFLNDLELRNFDKHALSIYLSIYYGDIPYEVTA